MLKDNSLTTLTQFSRAMSIHAPILNMEAVPNSEFAGLLINPVR